MGERLYPADEGNPKGYFEDVEINAINEDLLTPFVPKRPAGFIGNIFFRSRLVDGQRWLAEVPAHSAMSCSPQLSARIQAITVHAPFCLKDPRFCYTLPAWQPFLHKVVFLCVFRHPGLTAVSMVNEARRDAALRHVRVHFNIRRALQVWELMYRHIVEIHYPTGGEWLFVHYDQFLDGSAFHLIEEQLGVTIHREFVDARLNRSRHDRPLPQRIHTLYQKLCHLAGYKSSESEVDIRC